MKSPSLKKNNMFFLHEKDHQSSSPAGGRASSSRKFWLCADGLCDLRDVLVVCWRKSNKNLLRVGLFFMHRIIQRTSFVSVSTVLVKGVRHRLLFIFLFFRHPD